MDESCSLIVQVRNSAMLEWGGSRSIFSGAFLTAPIRLKSDSLEGTGRTGGHVQGEYRPAARCHETFLGLYRGKH